MAAGMTRPLQHNDQTDYDTLRRRWLAKYVAAQSKTDTRVRSTLVSSAEDAHKTLLALEKNSTFSAGVRTAQIRLAIRETKAVLHNLFKQIIPILQDGQGDEAEAAADGLRETDREYLTSALSSTDRVGYFLESQRQSARLGVAHAITQLTGSNQPLSARVYRTEYLANNWVSNTIRSSLLRGDSAADLAKAVRRSIRPGTPGGAAYAAMRLGRTELNNAFHATSVEMSKDRPWITGMKWNLSNAHEWEGTNSSPVEICERLHGRVFTVEMVPAKPHPQCRCFVTPDLLPFDVFLTHLTAGSYRDWIERAEKSA